MTTRLGRRRGARPGFCGTLVLAVLPLLAAAPLSAQGERLQGERLEWQWRPGATALYSKTVTSEQTERLDGEEEGVTQTGRVTTSWLATVDEVSADGVATIGWDYREGLQPPLLGDELHFRVARDGTIVEPPSTVELVASYIEGYQHQMFGGLPASMSRAGLEQGLETLYEMERMVLAEEVPPAEIEGLSDGELAELLDRRSRKAFNHVMEQVFSPEEVATRPVAEVYDLLPERAVAIGGSWSKRRTLSMAAFRSSIVQELTFTLTEIRQVDGERRARIAIAGTMVGARDDDSETPIAMGSFQQMPTELEIEGSSSGHLELSLDRGLLVELELADEMRMAIQLGEGPSSIERVLSGRQHVELLEASSGGQAGHLLAWHREPGTETHYRQVIETESTGPQIGEEIGRKSERNVVTWHEEITAVSDAGVATVDWTYDRHQQAALVGKTLNFDIDRQGAIVRPPSLDPVVEALLERAFDEMLGGRPAEMDREELEASIEAIDMAAEQLAEEQLAEELAPVEIKGMADRQLAELVDRRFRHVFRQMIEQAVDLEGIAVRPVGDFYDILPAGPVEAGDSWTKSWQLSIPMAKARFQQQLTFTLTGVEAVDGDRRAEIAVTGRLGAEEETAGEDGGTLESLLAMGEGFEFDGETSGTIVFSIDRGQLVDALMVNDLTVTLGADEAEDDPGIVIRQVTRQHTTPQDGDE